MKPLLAYLRQERVLALPSAPEAAVTPVERVLAGYAHYLRCERGLAETTIRCDVDLVRPFLARVETTDRVALERLDAGAVTGFVLARCREVGGKSASRMLTALRSLLGFPAHRRAHRCTAGRRGALDRRVEAHRAAQGAGRR